MAQNDKAEKAAAEAAEKAAAEADAAEKAAAEKAAAEADAAEKAAAEKAEAAAEDGLVELTDGSTIIRAHPTQVALWLAQGWSQKGEE